MTDKLLSTRTHCILNFKELMIYFYDPVVAVAATIAYVVLFHAVSLAHADLTDSPALQFLLHRDSARPLQPMVAPGLHRAQ